MVDLLTAYGAYKDALDAAALYTQGTGSPGANSILNRLRHLEILLRDLIPYPCGTAKCGKTQNDLDPYYNERELQQLLDNQSIGIKEKAWILMMQACRDPDPAVAAEKPNNTQSAPQISLSIDDVKLLLTFFDEFRSLLGSMDTRGISHGKPFDPGMLHDPDLLNDRIYLDTSAPPCDPVRWSNQLVDFICRISPLYDPLAGFDEQELGRILDDETMDLEERARRIMNISFHS